MSTVQQSRVPSGGEALAPSAPPGGILTDAAGGFRASFDRSCFAVTHGLGEHPLFELPRIRRLAVLLAKEKATKFNPGHVAVSERWDNMTRKVMPIEDVIDRIEAAGAWVLIKHVHHQPEYARLLQGLVAEIEGLSGRPFRRQVTWFDAYLFISSPGAVTPYHIDHETNFLLQIRGEKVINLFDGSDRSIISEEEIESYYMGDVNGAKYRAEVQQRAHVFALKPGLGVHLPPRWPHWATTGRQVSVSMSINFCLRSHDLEGRVYQANHYLRKLGLRPTPPGQSRIRDGVKKLILERFERRRPQSKDEVIRGPIRRIEAPMMRVKCLPSALKRSLWVDERAGCEERR